MEVRLRDFDRTVHSAARKIAAQGYFAKQYFPQGYFAQGRADQSH